MVWYVDYALKLGDHLRESIDYGLARANLGIVILAPSLRLCESHGTARYTTVRVAARAAGPVSLCRTRLP
jgi:hypothetical protein